MNLLINHRFIFNRLYAPLCAFVAGGRGDEMGGRTDGRCDYICVRNDELRPPLIKAKLETSESSLVLSLKCQSCSQKSGRD
jgi:hypothetical protein